MVPKWKKQLRSLQKSTYIDFETIIADIFGRQYHTYNIKKLSGEIHMYGIRVSSYRIIFSDDGEEIIIRSIASRGDVYKDL